MTIGIAGDVHSTASPLPASLRAHLPLISITDSGVNFVAGDSAGPLDTELRVELNWSKAAGQAITLTAIRATARLTPLTTPAASLHIVLEGLSLDDSPPKDTELDPSDLKNQAFQLVTGLLREELRQIAATAVGESAAVANHLTPLLGLADGFPSFPFSTLTSDPSAFRSWFSALVSGGKMAEWAGHLGAIFGGAAAASGSGTQNDPWRVNVFQIDANSQLEITFRASHS